MPKDNNVINFTPRENQSLSTEDIQKLYTSALATAVNKGDVVLLTNTSYLVTNIKGLCFIETLFFNYSTSAVEIDLKASSLETSGFGKDLDFPGIYGISRDDDGDYATYVQLKDINERIAETGSINYVPKEI